MPLLPGHDNGIVSTNVAELRKSGYPEAQAVAIALRKAGKAKPKKRRSSVEGLGASSAEKD